MIRVLLADDHQFLREGLRALLTGEPDIEVVGEAADGETVVHLARELRPDLVLMDITMGETSGVRATREIRATNPEVRIVALSVISDGPFVSGMLEAGVSGYLVKGSSFREIAEAIRTVMRGQTYLSPAVTGGIVEKIVHAGDAPAPGGVALLSPREREVLQLLAAGSSTKEIAQRIDISIRTVDTHRHHIMQKLDIDNVAGLTKYAIRMGLATLND